jgi:plasmid maintenance system antidote protein VapI
MELTKDQVLQKLKDRIDNDFGGSQTAYAEYLGVQRVNINAMVNDRLDITTRVLEDLKISRKRVRETRTTYCFS